MGDLSKKYNFYRYTSSLPLSAEYLLTAVTVQVLWASGYETEKSWEFSIYYYVRDGLRMTFSAKKEKKEKSNYGKIQI